MQRLPFARKWRKPNGSASAAGTCTFKTRQILALPEGEEVGQRASDRLRGWTGWTGYLGGKVASFDMRSADRIYMRVPGRAEALAASAQAEATAKANAAAAEDRARAYPAGWPQPLPRPYPRLPRPKTAQDQIKVMAAPPDQLKVSAAVNLGSFRVSATRSRG